jgi:hypothetical protein
MCNSDHLQGVQNTSSCATSRKNRWHTVPASPTTWSVTTIRLIDEVLKLRGYFSPWHACLCDVKTTDHMKAQFQLGEKSTDSQAFKTQHEKNPHHWSINSCLEAQLQRSNPL